MTRRRTRLLQVVCLSVLGVAVCSATAEGEQVRVAVIGDYGQAGSGELDVANLVKGWTPDLIITVGDNNYSSGAAETSWFHTAVGGKRGRGVASTDGAIRHIGAIRHTAKA